MTDDAIRESKPDMDVPAVWVDYDGIRGWMPMCPVCGNVVACSAWALRCCLGINLTDQLHRDHPRPGDVWLLEDESHDPTPCRLCGDPADARVFGRERSKFVCFGHVEAAKRGDVL